MIRVRNIFIVLFFTLFLFGCGGGGGGGTKSTNPSNPTGSGSSLNQSGAGASGDSGGAGGSAAKTLVGIEISADTAGVQARGVAHPSIPFGISTQYHATAVYSDGSNADLKDDEVQWFSNDTNIVSIDDHGWAKSKSAKSHTEIWAEYQGRKSASSTLSITDAAATKISIIAPITRLAKGLSLPLQAIATFYDDSTKDVTTLDVSPQVNWQSSNPAVLAIDKGTITANGAGDDIIVKASLPNGAGPNGISQEISREIHLSAVNLSVDSLQVTVADPVIAVGTQTRLTAIATLSDKSTLDVSSQVTWGTKDSKDAAAVIVENGTSLVTGLAQQSSIILTASLAGKTGETKIQVKENTFTTLQIIPAASTLAPGTQTQLRVIATEPGHSSQDVTDLVTWSSDGSDNNTVAEINHGLITAGSSAGTAKIRADWNGHHDDVELTVSDATLRSLQITPAITSLPTGLKQQFQAIATFSDNSSQDVTQQVYWNSSDDDVATIDLNGRVITVKPGDAIEISAKLLGHASDNKAALSVTAATLNKDGVTITTPPFTLAEGQSKQLTASGSYNDGTTIDVTSDVQWSSDNLEVATVSPSGLVTLVGAEDPDVTATITGYLNGQTAKIVVSPSTATLDANGLTLTNVDPLTPLSLAAGTSKQLAVNGSYSDAGGAKFTADVTADLQWISSDYAIATVSKTGLVTAVKASADPVTITGTDPVTDQFVTLQVEVTEAALKPNGLTITAGPLTLAAGFTTQLAASGVYGDGINPDVTTDVTTDVSWTSSDASVVSVGLNTGLVIAVKASTDPVTITGTLSGQSVKLEVSVTSATLKTGGLTFKANGLTLTEPPALTLAAGLTSQLTASGDYSDNTTPDVTTKVTWTSSDPAVATVGLHTGLVSAVKKSTNPVTITGTLTGQSVSLQVSVTDETLSALSITSAPGPLALAAGETSQLTANGVYSNGTTSDVTTNASWTSDNLAVATVGLHTGLVTAVSPGPSTGSLSATITGTLGGEQVSQSVTVTPAKVRSLIAKCDASLNVSVLGLGIIKVAIPTATENYTNGSNKPVTTVANWYQNGASIGVGLGGINIALLSGPVSYYATYGDFTSNTVTCR